jgi:hypothetical protein
MVLSGAASIRDKAGRALTSRRPFDRLEQHLIGVA